MLLSLRRDAVYKCSPAQILCPKKPVHEQAKHRAVNSSKAPRREEPPGEAYQSCYHCGLAFPLLALRRHEVSKYVVCLHLVWVCACVRTCMHACVHVHGCVRVLACVHASVCVRVFMDISVCCSMYTCVLVMCAWFHLICACV